MFYFEKGRVLWFQSLFREFTVSYKIRIRLLGHVYHFSLLICYPYSFNFFFSFLFVITWAVAFFCSKQMAPASYGTTLEKVFQQFQVSTKFDWMHISSCNLREKSVNHRSSIKCNLSQTISHLKSNNLNYVDGLYLKYLNISWYCWACCVDTFPFTSINNRKLYLSLNNTAKKYCGSDLKETRLVLKPRKN